MMQTIYEPRGAALEYAPQALNIYKGCGHGCLYCYAPACLRMSREEFARDPRPRKGVIEALEKYLAKHAAEVRAKGPVLLSFTSDPVQPAEEKYHATAEALGMLHRHGVGARLLTKAPRRAMKGAAFLKAIGVDFGTTLTGISDKAAREWEPFAEPPSMREEALLRAKAEDRNSVL
jgi:DNA repair photolyase